MAPIEVEVSINGEPVTMQVDTGASRSVMSKRLFKSLPVQPPLQPPDRALLTYTQEEVPVLGVAEVEVVYQNQNAVLPLVVVDTPGPPLLGREWLHRINWTGRPCSNRI